VLQSLFEWDFRKLSKEITASALERNVAEFAGSPSDLPFMRTLVNTVIERKADIDTVIEKAAPDWPIDKISAVDRNVLRLGLAELLFADRGEVPAKVAINEAIELAKTFGGENSGRFVNGVLGSVYKELGEPGKDETSKPKKGSVPYEKMPIFKLGGAVVYARHEGDIYVALVHDVFGHWTLPKGQIEEGKDEIQGTIQEIKEEIGLDITVQDPLQSNEYVASNPEKGKIRKQVMYFLAEAPFEELKRSDSGGLDDAQWFRMADLVNLNFYDDILPIVTKAINILVSGKTAKPSK
jgi:N utilization substance protein B